MELSRLAIVAALLVLVDAACVYSTLPAGSKVLVADKSVCPTGQDTCVVSSSTCALLADSTNWNAIGTFKDAPASKTSWTFTRTQEFVSLDFMSFPDRFDHLWFSGVYFLPSPKLPWPTNLKRLLVQDGNLKTISTLYPLPAKVRALDLANNLLSSSEDLRTLPRTINEVSYRHNQALAELANLDWTRLNFINVFNCMKLRSINMVKFSSSVQWIDLSYMTFTRWIIEESSFAPLNLLVPSYNTPAFVGYGHSGLKISTDASECTSLGGEIRELWADKTKRDPKSNTEVFKVCVVPDGGATKAPTTSTASVPKTTPAATTSVPVTSTPSTGPSPTFVVYSPEPTTLTQSPSSPTSPSTPSSPDLPSTPSTSSSGSLLTPLTDTPGSTSNLAQSEASSSSSNTVAIVGIGAGAVVLLAAIAFAFVRHRSRQHQPLPDTDLPSVGRAPPAPKYFQSNPPTQDTTPSTPYVGGSIVRQNDRGRREGLANDRPVRLDVRDLVLTEKLGSGAFADVWRALFLDTPVAAKFLHPGRATSSQVQSFVAEIDLMSRFDSPYIVKLIGAAWTRPADLMCVMELMDGGDLKQCLDSTTPATLSWAQKITLMQSIVEGLVYLHSLCIIHRDVKSKNILLDSTKGTKLTDFGISKEDMQATMTSGVGTFRWMAPEVLQDKGYSTAADIYSFGMVLSELDTHRLPYADQANSVNGQPLVDSAIILRVAAGTIKPTFSNGCPRWVYDLAMKCLALDPATRPTAFQLSYFISTQMKAMESEGFRL